MQLHWDPPNLRHQQNIHLVKYVDNRYTDSCRVLLSFLHLLTFYSHGLDFISKPTLHNMMIIIAVVVSVDIIIRIMIDEPKKFFLYSTYHADFNFYQSKNIVDFFILLSLSFGAIYSYFKPLDRLTFDI